MQQDKIHGNRHSVNKSPSMQRSIMRGKIINRHRFRNETDDRTNGQRH